MHDHIRALVIGAHPDDCEYLAGGLAVKYRALGHTVKFVSMTDGGAGHHSMDPAALVLRRQGEADRATGTVGVECAVLGSPDGRLQADVATREALICLIREFAPDLIFTHRTNDYHPDHRNTATLVQDCSYLVRVPLVCPTVPIVAETPVILYLYDHFRKPVPFAPDVAVAIDDVFDTKMKMLDAHESQFYEWLPFVAGYADEVPSGAAERLAWFTGRMREHDAGVAASCRGQLVGRYGPAGETVRCAEAFEVSEYGRPLPKAEIDDWIPR